VFHSRSVLAVVATALTFVAWAQQPPDAGSILQQQQPREQLPVAPTDKPVLPQVTPPRPALPVSPHLRVELKEFRFSGNTVFSSAVLAEVVRDFVGKTLDFNALNDAAGRVQRYYRDRGYFLAVAYLPEQEIRNGIVEIAILEGRLGSVILQIAPGTRLRESFVRGILDAHLKPGDLITEGSLERPLLLLRDLPDVDLASELGPSKTQIGAADLTVKLSESRRLVSGYVEADNYGNRFTGEYRGVLNLNSSNFTGYGDLLSFYGFITDENMKFGRLSYVIPVGYYGTRLGVSYTDFSYALAKDFTSLGAHGDGHVYTVYALHPFLRTRNANFFVQAGLEHKKLIDRQDNIDSLAERRVDSGKLGGVGDVRDRFFSGGLNSYSVTYTVGKVGLAPDTLQAVDAAAGVGPQTSGHFSKLNIDLRRLQRVTDSFNLLLAFSGQKADKNLVTAEKISLGGPNGVRAYPVGEAPGDTGAIVNGELRYIFPNYTVLGGDITASAFYDAGWVKTLESPPPADPTAAHDYRTIAGYGVGASLGREGNFLVRGYLAWRADHDPPQSDTARRVPRVWVQAVKWF
jgi:hemolysin activation/secretion protein